MASIGNTIAMESAIKSVPTIESLSSDVVDLKERVSQLTYGSELTDYGTSIPKSITSAGALTARGECYLIPIANAIESITIYVDADVGRTSYAWLTSDNLSGANPKYATGCSIETVYANAKVSKPSDATILYIQGKTSTGVNRRPTKVVLHSVIAAAVDAYKESVSIGSLKYYAIGDSITRGMYANIGASGSNGRTDDSNYACWVAKVNGYTFDDSQNLGVSGSGYANKGGNTSDESGSTNGVTIVDSNDFSEADIISIMYGINDYKGTGISLGSMSSTKKDGSVIGNMKYMIETISTKAPKAQIVIILPMNQNRHGDKGMNSGFTDDSTNWSFGYAFREGKTLADYRAAIRECAEYYNVKVIDAEELCPINRLNIRSCLGDGLHPTLEFHKRMGLSLAPYIK